MDERSVHANPANTDAEFEESVDIKEILRIVRANRWSILSIFSAIFLLAIYLNFTTQPEFQATTTVMIKRIQADAGAFILDFGGPSSTQHLKNEIEVLESYSLHERVIDELIETGQADRNALFGTRYLSRRYRIFDYVTKWISGKQDPIKSAQDMTKSQKIRIVNKLRHSTQVSNVRETDLLKIAVTLTDSVDAINLANRIATLYRNYDLAGGQGEIKFVLTFLDSQITKYEARLAEIEEDLRTFQEENQIYSVDGAANLLLKNLTQYETIYYTNLAELEVAQGRVDYLRNQLSESEQALIEEIVNTNNPMIVALRKAIAETEAQKIKQMVDEGWEESSLQARDYERRIEEMKARLTALTQDLILSGWNEEDPFAASQEIFNKIVEQEVEVEASRSRAEEYKKLVEQMSDRLNFLPSQTLAFARLERERELNENLYLEMKEQYEEYRITEAGQVGKVRILDRAQMAYQVAPNTQINLLIGLVLGLGLGLGYAFSKEYLDYTIKSVEQLERKGLTVLGIVPDIHQDQKQFINRADQPSRGGVDFQRRLITHEDPKSPISEAYRTLRTNVFYSSADKKIKSIIVSSPSPGEGKSTTVANLAIAFAQLRKRTLLIDTDLRKPVQHNVFGIDRKPGITEYLVGDVTNFNEVIQKTAIENLSIATAGIMPPNPSELLGSERMGQLVDRLEGEWDMVLFDSPPIVAVTDASTISAEIDRVVMVVKASQTDRYAIDRALDTLRNVKAPLAGVVLNGVRPERLGGKYSYYYSYYQYYYASDDGGKKRRSSRRKSQSEVG